MWLIAHRSFVASWPRLAATVLAILLSVALAAGTLTFAALAQQALTGPGVSEYSRADLVVQAGEVDVQDPWSQPRGTVPIDVVASLPGVAAVTGDARVPLSIRDANGTPVQPPAGTGAHLRPWIDDPLLSAYRLVSGRAPAKAGEIVVGARLADVAGLHVGSRTTLALPTEVQQVGVVGVVTVEGQGAVTAGDLVLAPADVVRTAARLAPGAWPRLWVTAAPGETTAQLHVRLQDALVEPVTVTDATRMADAEASARSDEGQSVASTLSLLALVAVFIGLFVVANTFGSLVQQRTRQLALLAGIGMRPRQISRLLRLEALILGVVASGGGLIAGLAVTRVLTKLFAADGIDVTGVRSPYGPALSIAVLAGGVTVTQVAAWRAARRAAGVAPTQALRASQVDPRSRRWPRLLGSGLLAGGAALFAVPAVMARSEEPAGIDRTLIIACLVMLAGMLAAAALATLAPLLVGPLGGLIGRIGTAVSGEPGRLARAAVTRSPRRISSAASALMLAVTLAVTPAILVTSVDQRFAQTGDAVMTATHAVATIAVGGTPPLPADTAARLADVPGVQTAVTLTSTSAQILGAGRDSDASVQLVATVPSTLASVLELGPDARSLRNDEVALTPTARQAHGLRDGDRVTLRGASGQRRLTVRGTVRDPSHLFVQDALVTPWTIRHVDNLAATQAVLLRAPGAATTVITAAVADASDARVYTKHRYLEIAAAQVQDASALRVVYAFLAMALVIATFGMATTVSLGVSARTREFGLLGAVGFTRRQIRAVVRWEAATVVVLGTALGVGTAVGTITVIHLISDSSFIRVVLPPWLVASVLLGATAVTLMTTALPARRATRVPVLVATAPE